MTVAVPDDTLPANIQISVVSTGYARGVRIPWWLKMAIKITLSRMPVPYGLWAKLGVFRHGDVDKKLPNLQGGFSDHFQAYQQYKGGVPGVCLELGPGDSIGHALSGKAAGVSSTCLIDAGDFARKDDTHYRAFYDYLLAQGASFGSVPQAFDRQSILDFTGSTYKTEGLASTRTLPADQTDFSYSTAVFEHIYRDEFQPLMHELYRIHKPGSVSRHWVDLHDHLGGSLNSLRFSPSFWESGWVRKAGFYTNRLRMRDMVEMARIAGFIVEVPRIIRWPSLPIDRRDIHVSLPQGTDDDLNVCTFLMVMQKK